MREDKFVPNSFQLPNAIVDEVLKDISNIALKCYLVIVRKTVGWGKEWDKISTTQLMELTGTKKRNTIYKAIKELEDISLVESIKETGRLTSFRLVPPNDTSTTKGNRSSTTKGYRVVPPKGTGSSTTKGYTTKNNINTLLQKNEKINIEACKEWFEYKKYKTQAPITKTINFLSRFPKDIQQQIVDTSIMNNYKGLFEPKGISNTGKKKEVLI